MPKNKPELQKISFNLYDEEIKIVWQLAKERGVAPAKIVREFFEAGMRKFKILHGAEGYF